MSGVITTGSYAKALRPGLKKIWGLAYNDHVEVFSRVFMKESSDKSYEERTGSAGLGLARVKDQGSGTFYDSMQQGFTRRSTNVAYSLGFIITREMIKDNQYRELSASWTKSLARSFRQTKEINGANILNRAFNNSYTYVDGLELCSTANLTKSGVTYSNELATPADLSEASLEQLLIQIKDAVGERGLRIALQPRSLIVSNENMFNAHRIVNSALRSGSADNDTNAIKDMGALPGGIITWNYLTDPDAWFVTTDCPDGMIYQEREAIEFDSDNDFNTKNAMFSAYERYVFDVVDKRGVYGSAGA